MKPGKNVYQEIQWDCQADFREAIGGKLAVELIPEVDASLETSIDESLEHVQWSQVFALNEWDRGWNEYTPFRDRPQDWEKENKFSVRR